MPRTQHPDRGSPGARRGSPTPPLSLLTNFVTEFILLCVLGLIVAVAMIPLLHLDLVQAIDRNVSDLLMRQLAREQLIKPEGDAPRLVYIDISEETCEIWAAGEATACTLSMVTPRDHLSQILETITNFVDRAAQKPRLVVLDVELAPLPHSGSLLNAADDALCVTVIKLARRLPVVVPRPVVIGLDPSGILIRAYPSIFDAPYGDDPVQCGSEQVGANARANNLWLASPLLQADPDGIVRSVHAWDTVWNTSTLRRGRLGGIGFLSAALLSPNISPAELACAFPESKTPSDVCHTETIVLAGRTYPLAEGTAERIDRLLFLLPYDEPGRPPSGFYGYNPSVIDTIDARKIADANPTILDGAVVVIGGSYFTSGDLHLTPLGGRMPGAIVHANAIRAFATGGLVQEHKSWVLKFLLIATAALIGATFHVAGARLRSRLGRIAGEVARILVLSVGIIVAVLVVLLIGFARAFAELAETGTALGTLTPALAVAFEGLSGILHELKEMTERMIKRVLF